MSYAEDVVRALPTWRGPISLSPLKGGVSNTSFKVDDSSGSYVARVGHDYPFHQVQRAREAVAAQAAHACGLSPEMVYARDGVMVLRYIDAQTCGEADVRDRWDECLSLVAKTHREMAGHITGQGAIFWVFQILRDYGTRLIDRKHRLAGSVPKWMKAVDQLEAAQVPLPIVFGHHDLLPTNFMHDGKRLWLIDWEYGAFGTAMFDLANLASNNSFDRDAEGQMLRAYFGGEQPHSVIRAFYAMKCASALREAMWGMISELYLAAPGVDYVAYAAEYLGRFDAIHAAYEKEFGQS